MTFPEFGAVAGADDRARHAGTPRRSARRYDLAALLSFLLLAFWVAARLWVHPGHRLIANRPDQAQFEWMLAHGARTVTHLSYPFVSYQMNSPDGVNLMANTSVLAISLPLSPLTLTLGPRVAFNVFLTLALFGTATVWYFVLSRRFVRARAAAWVGAGFCGFAPNMVSHANGHPNIAAQFLVPLIVWRTLRLRQPGRWLRNGTLLGLLIVVQAFINMEVLLMTAVGLGIVLGVAAGLRPDLRRDHRPFLAGLGVSALLAGILLAYPLYVQFSGPYAYQGLSRLIRGYRADLASFVAFSRESVAGDARSAKPLVQNASEENAFFGWPLVVLLGALVWWLRRNPVVVALTAAGAVFALLSLGRSVRLEGRDTHIPAPWAVLERLPILHSVVPTRWALAITPVVGLLLALGVQRAVDLGRAHPAARPQIRFVTATALAMALIPVAPTPLPTAALPPAPGFVTSGAWRDYLAGGRSLVTVPLPDDSYPDPLRWAAETGLDLRLARGYFLAPDTRPDARPIALFSAVPRPTSTLLKTVRRTGKVPPITAENRAAALDDLRFWRAGAAVLAPQRHDEALRQTMTELIGIEPVRTGGVWLWDVRPLHG